MDRLQPSAGPRIYAPAKSPEQTEEERAIAEFEDFGNVAPLVALLKNPATAKKKLSAKTLTVMPDI